jgi:hypothetical protein
MIDRQHRSLLFHRAFFRELTALPPCDCRRNGQLRSCEAQSRSYKLLQRDRGRSTGDDQNDFNVRAEHVASSTAACAGELPPVGWLRPAFFSRC